MVQLQELLQWALSQLPALWKLAALLRLEQQTSRSESLPHLHTSSQQVLAQDYETPHSDKRKNKGSKKYVTAAFHTPKVSGPTSTYHERSVTPDSFCTGPACLPNTEGPAAIATRSAKSAVAFGLTLRGPATLRYLLRNPECLRCHPSRNSWADRASRCY